MKLLRRLCPRIISPGDSTTTAADDEDNDGVRVRLTGCCCSQRHHLHRTRAAPSATAATTSASRQQSQHAYKQQVVPVQQQQDGDGGSMSPLHYRSIRHHRSRCSDTDYFEQRHYDEESDQEEDRMGTQSLEGMARQLSAARGSTSSGVSAQHLTGPIRFGPMMLRPSKKSALLVSASVDDTPVQVLAELTRCRWHSRRCGDGEEALRSYKQYWPHLVVVDARHTAVTGVNSKKKASALTNATPNSVGTPEHNWDPCRIAHSLYSLKEDNDTVFVALVEKWPDEIHLKNLADCGISQVIRVAGGIASFRDCLQLLELVWPLQVKVRAVAALFAIIEDSDVPVEITDDNSVVQYVNRAYERSTGSVRADVLGSQSSDLRRRSLLPPSRAVTEHLRLLSTTDRKASQRSQSEDPPTNHHGPAGPLSATKRHSGSGVDRIKVDSWNCIAVSQPSTSDRIRRASTQPHSQQRGSLGRILEGPNSSSTDLERFATEVAAAAQTTAVPDRPDIENAEAPM